MTVAVTYHIARACGLSRGWSLYCETTYAVDSTEGLRCGSRPPSVICVGPKISSAECDECPNTQFVGVLNFSLPTPDYPANWSGAFGLTPLGSCQWLGKLPVVSDSITTVTTPECAAGVLGRWTREAELSLTLFASGGPAVWTLTFREISYFQVTSNPNGCPYAVGDKLFLTTPSNSLGGHSSTDVDCGETFTVDQIWPTGSSNTITVNLVET